MVEFFGQTRPYARSEIAALRQRLDSGGSHTRSPNSFTYHSEPLHVAADLLDIPVPDDARLKRRYYVLRDQYDEQRLGPQPEAVPQIRSSSTKELLKAAS